MCVDAGQSMAVSAFAAPWTAPTPLEGVKSRKRAIYSIDSAEVAIGDEVSQLSGVRLSLESRIAAVGEAGRAVAGLLLGKSALALGKPKQHEKLVVAHLGPHLAGGIAVSTEAHLALMESTLQRDQPQIIVLDEALTSGDEAWAQAFAIALGSLEIRRFNGSVIVSVDSEVMGAAVEGICSEQWVGAAGWVWQEKCDATSLTILEDVLSPLKGSDLSMSTLLQEASTLSAIAFSEDSVAKARAKGWTLTLLIDEEEGSPTLRGFMAWEVKRGELKIGRLAVPHECRGGGYGQRLMQWILLKAARMPRSECAWISLSSLATAVSFYEKYGFTDMTCEDVDDPELFQIRMELRNRSVVPEEDASEPETE